MTYVEKDCIFTHNGRAFESGGAAVTDSHLVAYPAADGTLNDWHGNVLGTWRVISSRPAVFFGHRSWIGSQYFYMRARLTSGAEYSLRGFGPGMVAMGKRLKVRA